jgi:hypothetical protein
MWLAVIAAPTVGAGKSCLSHGAPDMFDAHRTIRWVVTGKWMFYHNLSLDGSLGRYMDRWVLWGFTKCSGVDYDETFTPDVKFSTIRAVLSLALSRDWAFHQLDIKNAFLHDTPIETVRLLQPAHRLHHHRSSGSGVPAEPLRIRPQVGNVGLVHSFRFLLGLPRLC